METIKLKKNLKKLINYQIKPINFVTPKVRKQLHSHLVQTNVLFLKISVQMLYKQTLEKKFHQYYISKKSGNDSLSLIYVLPDHN